MSLAVKSKTNDLVKCVVVDGGELKSRRHLNVRGKSATLPSITGNRESDWCLSNSYYQLFFRYIERAVLTRYMDWYNMFYR